MRRVPFLFLSLALAASAWEDYDDDDVYWNPTRPVRPSAPWPPTTPRPTPTPTRRTSTVYRPHEYRPGPDECDQYRTNQMADRIFEQLMRQSNGNAVTALVQLETRYNVRPTPGCSTNERLGTVVNAATARMTASGYGYYRPVIYAVADQLADALATGGTVNVNLRPAQGSGSISATITFSGPNSNNNHNNRPANNRNNSPNWWAESGQSSQRATTTTSRPDWWRTSGRDLQRKVPGTQDSHQGMPDIGQATSEQDPGIPEVEEIWSQNQNDLSHPQSVSP